MMSVPLCGSPKATRLTQPITSAPLYFLFDATGKFVTWPAFGMDRVSHLPTFPAAPIIARLLQRKNV